MRHYHLSNRGGGNTGLCDHVLRSESSKEHIKICTDSQSVIANVAVAVDETKTLLDAEKLAQLPEKNWLTIVWAFGIPIKQNETADYLAKKGAKTGSVYPESFLPLLCSGYKPKPKVYMDQKKKKAE